MSANPEVELELDHIAHGGEAIGRWERKPVFVPFAIPGEKVRVRIVEDRPRYARAELLEVLRPSPDRVEPPCPYFGTCGGCDWQHISYRRQLELRLDIIADQMQRLGRISDPPVDGIVPADDPWAYRNNIVLYPVTARPEGPSEALGLGFHTTDGRTVMPIAKCLIAHDLVDHLHSSLELEWGGLRSLTLRAGVTTGDLLVLLETDRDEGPELALDLAVSFAHLTGAGDLITLVGLPYIHEQLAGRTFRIFAPSPFPPFTAQAGNLTEVVREFSGLTGGERVLDLFCGVGTLALTLAPYAAEVVGVEPSAWAAADAQANGEDVPNFTIHEGDVVEVLPSLEGNFPVVVASPPRAGLGEALTGAITALRPERLVYVSSDPAGLARDAVFLTQAGYEARTMLALDMYPQFARVQTVALFSQVHG
ncbi:MAG: 23S rRNA (uracil(1939)-C(5))-methyltransferase RlmD [Anaerolineae bacterium]|jgi:23S rRNA (uracil1939-C5)-methyltransferase